LTKSELEVGPPARGARVAALVAVAVVTIVACLLSSFALSSARSAIGTNVVVHTEAAWLVNTASADHIVAYGYQVEVAYRSTWAHTMHWRAGSLGQFTVSGTENVRPGQIVHFWVPTSYGVPQSWFTIRIGKLTTPLQVRLSA
jgi:hypothetical protein